MTTGDGSDWSPVELALLERDPDDLLGECERQPFQASGAGGQNRNRTYSAVRLVHPSGYRAECGEYREAARNLSLALRRLRRQVALACARTPLDDLMAHPDPVATFVQRTREWPPFRFPVNEEHRDVPGFIARVLILLRLFQARPGPVAEKLGASTSALVKFCKKDRDLWRVVQESRKRHELSPLK